MDNGQLKNGCPLFSVRCPLSIDNYQLFVAFLPIPSLLSLRSG